MLLTILTYNIYLKKLTEFQIIIFSQNQFQSKLQQII